MKAPLDGVKIIDLTACFTGPSAGPWLADFGAEIIKIEPAQGSEERRISTSLYLQNESRSHRIFYRGKKSFIIDINKPEGKEIVCKLIANSDVIMHNFCYGVMDNLGFDYETLSKINPHIIYVNMSSYGDSGTYNRDFLGYDMFAQGVTRI
ncbi:MAG: CoA transferase [Thermodesulfobacteriota bacterium]|nr:CoA transferase [Thermodesulfobacteriota bacterium]